MKSLPTFVFLTFFLVEASLSSISLHSFEPLGEKKIENDPGLEAVAAFNEERYHAAVRIAKPLAETGNVNALLVMGLACESGNGTEKSQELALENYRKAREAGSSEASYRLVRLLVEMGGEERQKEAQSVLEALANEDGGNAARMLGEGTLNGWFGKDADFDQTRSWWEKAAEKGDVASILGLARLLDGEFGFPEKRDSSAALKQYLKAAALGNASAMTIAGSRLLNGPEETRDEEKARELLSKAIENEQWDAYLVLGNYAEVTTKSDVLAFEQYLKGSEVGQSQCMLKVGSFILEGRAAQKKDSEKALAWFKKAAESGQVLGHVQAASILMNGEGLEIVEGYVHLVVAAESGLVDMQNEVGLIYLSGRLGVRDATAAASWFNRSASGRYPPGAYNLATLYEQGIGVPQNLDQAGRLYTLAANGGHAQSTTALGRLHAEGRGTKQNLPRSWALFSLAEEHGDEEAKGFLEQVASRLSEDEMKLARTILSELKKAPEASKKKEE